MNKIFLKSYIFSYNGVCNYLNILYKNNKERIEKICIGKTSFGYDIDCYKIGKGKKHVLLFALTHGSEIVTTYFLLEFMTTLLKEASLKEILEKYTFHLIPILNVEGFIISSSVVSKNFLGKTLEEIESLSKRYLNIYNKDDENVKNGCHIFKNFYNVLDTSIFDISNFRLRESVGKIIKKCGLDSRVMTIWAANGCGVDPNSNSIHCFKEIKRLRRKQKVANLRYNDIPVTIPSPMSYPGECTFGNCPENFYLYLYIKKLCRMNSLKIEDKFVAIFSYHSTGGQIYGLPNINFLSKEKLLLYRRGMDIYSKITGYEIMEDKYKFGVMDYYRECLDNVLSLTIELSKLNANPIGPFSNIELLNDEIIENKNAIIATLDIM